MNDPIFTSASIVSYNSRQKTLNAVDSLLRYTDPDKLKLYVIDNGSTDGTVEALRDRPGVTLIENGKNVGFGAAHNQVLSFPHGKYHAVINPDIVIDRDVIGHLTGILEQNPDIAMITPKILNEDGSEQTLPKKNPTVRYLFLGRLMENVRRDYVMADQTADGLTDIEFCTGCFFVIRSEVFEKLGGFDTRYFMYLEDADLSRRARAFGRAVFCPDCGVTHLWERSSAKSPKYFLIHLSSCIKYLVKWRGKKK